MRLQLRCRFLLIEPHPIAKICYLNIWLRIRCGICIAHKSYVCCRNGSREGRSTLFEDTILKARIGETGPLLSQLPQLLSQLLHRLEKRSACFRAYARPFLPLQRHSSVGSRPTRTRITAIEAKTIGPWNLRLYFPLPEPIESDSGAKKACHRQNCLI